MKRFNQWLALKITDGVATMWCAYLFATLAISGFPGLLGDRVLKYVLWTSTIFLQLVLLSIILVGQKLQADATIKHVQKHSEKLDAIHRHLKIK